AVAEPTPPSGPRLPGEAPGRLRGRPRRLQLARAPAVQLRHRLVRRAGRGEPGRRGALGGRRGGGDPADLPRARGPLRRGRPVPPPPRPAARRPPARRARQRRAAVGGDARRDQAGRRRHPGDAAALRRRPRRPRRSWGRPDAGGRRGRRRQVHRPRPAAGPARGGRGHRPGRVAGLPTRRGLPARRPAPARDQQGRRPGPAVLHLWHHGQSQAGRAQPDLLPGRAPLDPLLDGPAAGRRPPQHLLARLGQARLEQLLHPLAGRCHGAGAPVRPLRPRRAARGPRPLRGHDVLRPADGVADARPDRPRRHPDLAAGAAERRRAAEPRGDRARPGRLGSDDPRRLRPDRDHGAGGQPARGTAEDRLDGPSAAGLRRRPRRPRQRGGQRDRGRAVPAAGPAPRRPDEGLQGHRRHRRRRAERRVVRRRRLPHRRRRQPRRRRLPHLRRPGRRRVQVQRLQDQPVRARVGADRAPGRRRGRCRRRARPHPAGRAQGLRHPRRRARARRRDRPLDPRPRPRAPGPLPAGSPAGVRRAAEDDQRQDPPRRAARGRGGPGRPLPRRVPGHRLRLV
ncbi:MAG: Acetyl-CoA synthetase, partial [uncultured Friedmanniella sp.]